MEFGLFNSTASIIAAAVGGVGVKVIEKLMSKRKEYFDEATRIREELRKEVDSLKKEMEAKSEQVNFWRDKYYEQVEENVKMLAETELLRSEIRQQDSDEDQ